MINSFVQKNVFNKSTAPDYSPHHQDSLSIAKAKYLMDHPGTERHSPELAQAVEVLLKELCG